MLTFRSAAESDCGKATLEELARIAGERLREMGKER